MNPSPTATATPAAERRRAPRRQPTLGTVCRIPAAEGHGRLVGLVWNMSASGLSMLLNESLETGSAVPGELATVDGAVALPVTLKVAHVSRLKTGDYILGGQFDRPLTGDEMRPFLGKSATTNV
jgi:hypothetical protein